MVGLSRSAIAALPVMVMAGPAFDAQGEEEWKPLTDAHEVRELVADRTLDGKYWRNFYRRDGNMAYHHVETDAMSVRKWKIEDDGRLCVAVFQKPDRVIDCFTILRSGDDVSEYQLKWGSGINAFELLDQPPETWPGP